MNLIFTFFYCHFNRLETNFEQFQEKAKQSVKDSLNEVFNELTVDDPHYIKFTHYNPEIHDPVKKEIYTPKVSIII